MAEMILSRSALDRYLPIWGVALSALPPVTAGEPSYGILLISDRERRTLPPVMIPTDSGSKLVRRL
jgi:hypothetical protein